MKLYPAVLCTLSLCFSSVSAITEKDKTEVFETADTPTWGAFIHAASDSLQKWLNGQAPLKETTVLKNSSNRESVSFRLYDIKYKPDIDGAIAVSMGSEGIMWAKTIKPIVGLPFTNNKIRLVSTNESHHQIKWHHSDEFVKFSAEAAHNHLFILAIDSNLCLETYWSHYKKTHDAMGASNIETLYDGSLYFCPANMPDLSCSSEESLRLLNDILHLSRLLWLPKEFHTDDNLTQLRQTCKRILQYKNERPALFEKLMLYYGHLLFHALYHKQWTF